MTDAAKEISVVVEAGGSIRGGEFLRESIALDKLSTEITEFVKDIGSVLEAAAANATASAKLTEVTVSASIEMGGKVSLLGTGVESKGQAGITFKFAIG